MIKHNRRHFLRSLAVLPAAAATPGILLSGSKNKDMKTKRSPYTPPYADLQKSGELKARGKKLHERMRHCDLCPRDCGTDRIAGRRGSCRAHSRLEISSASAHFGEEQELVGRNGSGTVFFTNCSMHCVFCINYEVSQLGQGREYTSDQLAEIMILMQRRGCHNINLVSPTHYIPQILLALDKAVPKGLNIPLVYNTSGWEKKEILGYLDGIVDIYLADFKYADPDAADTYSPGAACYPETARTALLEMNRQVGRAAADPDTGLMSRGLMIRHLVMPENVARSDKVVRWIANNLPKDTYVNIMSQYTPIYKAFDYPEISRRLYRSEYNDVVTVARDAGLSNLRLQMQ